MTIVLTLPDFVEGEARRIAELLASGRADLVHVRKPGSQSADVERLLQAVPDRWHGRLVLHEHFELAQRYGLYGVHLNRRCPEAPAGWQGSVSISSHSLEELARLKQQDYHYISLSPIFDSISKTGYRAAFTRAQLLEARQSGLIDHRVMALGGIRFEQIPEVLQLGFGGVMILGDAWKQY